MVDSQPLAPEAKARALVDPNHRAQQGGKARVAGPFRSQQQRTRFDWLRVCSTPAGYTRSMCRTSVEVHPRIDALCGGVCVVISVMNSQGY